MIVFIVNASGAFGVREYLESWGRTEAKHVDVLLYEDLPKKSFLKPATYIFAALDQLTPAQREMAAQLRDRLTAASLRTLNHPLRTMRRYSLLSAAHQCGVNAFRAFRTSDHSLDCRYPVFIRMKDEHTGSLTGLLDNPQALRAALLRLQLRGYHRSDLLVVEYCDTRGGDGLYRKYSAFIVGKRIIARAMSFDRHWETKAGPTCWDEARAREELDYLESNPHERELRRIFDLAGVQYGRADYGVLAGTPQIWEINLNPTIAPRLRQSDEYAGQRELTEMRRPGKALFFSQFARALRDIDNAASIPGNVPIRLNRKLARRIQRERHKARLRRSHRSFVWSLSRSGAAAFVSPVLKRIESTLVDLLASRDKEDGTSGPPG